MKIKDKKLVFNALRCNACGDEIVSVHRHDFNCCKCGAICIDGGLEYERRAGDIYNYTDLCQYEEYEREEYSWETEKRERLEQMETSK